MAVAGMGKAVNKLRKHADEDIASMSKAMVKRWKALEGVLTGSQSNAAAPPAPPSTKQRPVEQFNVDKERGGEEKRGAHWAQEGNEREGGKRHDDVLLTLSSGRKLGSGGGGGQLATQTVDSSQESMDVCIMPLGAKSSTTSSTSSTSSTGTRKAITETKSLDDFVSDEKKEKLRVQVIAEMLKILHDEGRRMLLTDLIFDLYRRIPAAKGSIKAKAFIEKNLRGIVRMTPANDSGMLLLSLVPVCRFAVLPGGCKRGDSCEFSHATVPIQDASVAPNVSTKRKRADSTDIIRDVQSVTFSPAHPLNECHGDGSKSSFMSTAASARVVNTIRQIVQESEERVLLSHVMEELYRRIPAAKGAIKATTFIEENLCGVVCMTLIQSHWMLSLTHSEKNRIRSAAQEADRFESRGSSGGSDSSSGGGAIASSSSSTLHGPLEFISTQSTAKHPSQRKGSEGNEYCEEHGWNCYHGDSCWYRHGVDHKPAARQPPQKTCATTAVRLTNAQITNMGVCRNCYKQKPCQWEECDRRHITPDGVEHNHNPLGYCDDSAGGAGGMDCSLDDIISSEKKTMTEIRAMQCPWSGYCKHQPLSCQRFTSGKYAGSFCPFNHRTSATQGKKRKVGDSQDLTHIRPYTAPVLAQHVKERRRIILEMGYDGVLKPLQWSASAWELYKEQRQYQIIPDEILACRPHPLVLSDHTRENQWTWAFREEDPRWTAGPCHCICHSSFVCISSSLNAFCL
jgi:hypothetical protein